MFQELLLLRLHHHPLPAEPLLPRLRVPQGARRGLRPRLGRRRGEAGEHVGGEALGDDLRGDVGINYTMHATALREKLLASYDKAVEPTSHRLVAYSEIFTFPGEVSFYRSINFRLRRLFYHYFPLIISFYLQLLLQDLFLFSH